MAKNLFPRRAMVWCGALMLAAGSAAAAVVTGNATEVAPDIRHPNGNLYDQVLMTGTSATIRNDPGQVTRVSFVDLNEDIVQVEFGGAGSLAIDLASASGPGPAQKYNQPGVSYMKGHASLTITGSDSTTSIGVFSVGVLTAQNLFNLRPGEKYDGVADLQRLTIVADPLNPNGSAFGSIRAGNAQFWGASGVVGISADKIQVQGLVVIGDIWAVDSATPFLLFGFFSQFGTVTLAGGNLSQPNGKAVVSTGASSYLYVLDYAEGRTSNNVVLPRQTPRG